MRQALSGRRGPRIANRPGKVSQSYTLPVPVEGWDTDTPVAELPPTRAIVLDNWIPKGIALEMRRGYTDHVTGVSDPVETLMPYNAGSGATLFAAADDSIYDVTSAGAVGAASLGSLTSARFSFVNFQTSGGTYLWICNGLDNPRHWNGSTWATPALTVTTYADNDISFVFESKQRLFFIFKNTLTFGYLPVDSIAGTVSNFPLGSVFSRGGRLIAGGRVSFDAGDGADDYTFFLTSEGEVVFYQGVDPSSSATWARVGTFYCGEPVGDRPIVKLGGDVAVITLHGVVPLRQLFGAGEQLGGLHDMTERVSTAFSRTMLEGRAYDGWEGLFYPAGNLLILNAPTSDTEAVQFVKHEITGGWTRFTAWNFATFAIFNGLLYAGGYAGEIVLCDNGHSDGGDDIVAAYQTPWQSLGGRGVVKSMRMARPVVTTETGAAVRLVARSDYRENPALPAFPVNTLSNALIWGEGNWGEKVWGGQDLGARQWRAISGAGHTISIVLEARGNQSAYSINGIDVIYEYGGPV